MALLTPWQGAEQYGGNYGIPAGPSLPTGGPATLPYGDLPSWAPIPVGDGLGRPFNDLPLPGPVVAPTVGVMQPTLPQCASGGSGCGGPYAPAGGAMPPPPPPAGSIPPWGNPAVPAGPVPTVGGQPPIITEAGLFGTIPWWLIALGIGLALLSD